MATQGPNLVGTGADVSGVGTITWGFTSNITADDNSSSTMSFNGTNIVSHYLQGTNCAFSIPTSATIDGIVVEIEKSKSIGVTTGFDNVVSLVKGGSITGNNKADTTTDYPTGNGNVFSYGSSSDLWGLSFTPAEINASNFGAVISCKGTRTGKGNRSINVDFIRITVTYTDATSADVLPPQMIFWSLALFVTSIASKVFSVAGLRSSLLGKLYNYLWVRSRPGRYAATNCGGAIQSI